ncbi:MAG: hypothetical protein Ta2G_18820 [Termitinemataceae bacterium]|nr:MAG: hypothetical protein Ta2G_18820 [Termitinemataceae bacterium]
MINNKQNKIDNTVYFLLFIIAFFFVFSSTYNPFNFRRMHVDSSVYMSITKGICQELLPYRDFVDNKGPLMYLLGVPLFMLAGFTGVWLTELLLMCIAVLFAYKTALFFTSKYKALVATACTFVAALAFFTVPAGTEEYALPFLIISLYIFTKYYFSPNRDVSLPHIIALGFCFAAAILIRLNMFPLWSGFCFIIFIEAIAKRRFALLLKYVTGFFIGAAIICVPIFLYLKINGIMDDFIYQVISGSSSRGFGGWSIKTTAKNVYIVMNRAYCIVPLLWGVFALIKNYKQEHFVFWAGYTFSYILAVLFLSFSSGGSHYNLTLIPFFIPPIAVFLEALYSEFSAFSAFSTIRKKNMVITLFLCLVFSEGLVKYLDDLLEIFTNHSGRDLRQAGKMIDANTTDTDTIISLGFNGYIYPFTQRHAASKYFFQGSGVDLIPGSRQEFLSDVLQKKPAIIAIFTAETNGSYDYLPVWYNPIFDLIDSEYRILSLDNGYVLFIRE